jgi:putative membrane protein (TIGR04086 family)
MVRNIFSVIAGVLTASLLFGIGGLILLITQLNKIKGHGEDTDVESIARSFTIFSMLIIVIAMIIGAFVTVKISTRKDLAHGLITGAVCAVLFAYITEFDITTDTLVLYLVIMLAAGAGTLIGMHTKKKKNLNHDSPH